MFVGIDIGTGSVKVTLLMPDGSALGGSEKYEEPLGNGIQEISSLERACSRILRSVVEVSKAKSEPVEGITASGHGPSLIVVDEAGNPCTQIITWQDSSNTSEASELATHYPGFTKTGECWEAKVVAAWRKDCRSRNGSTALYPKDYCLFLLCGRKVMDHATASTLVFYDRERQSWNSHSMHVDPGFLPEVVRSWEETGRTGTSFSRSCGLEDGIPIYSGGIDAWCEAVGAGAIEPGMLVDGSGTSTCISMCLAKGRQPLEHVIPERAFRIETISYTGGSARWAEQVLGFPIESWKANNADGIPVPVLFLPYLIGERSPVWDERASAVFLGLRKENDAEDLMGAVFQGTAFAVAQCLGLIDPTEATRAVRAVGGGANNIPWIKMKVSATGRTYQVMQEKNSAPLGSAIIGAYGGGFGSLKELISKYVRIEREIEPDPKHREIYLRLMDAYVRVYRDLGPEMELLAEVRSRACGD